jgi:hypothetical protein
MYGYRAATTRQCQNNGSLANGEAFIQYFMNGDHPITSIEIG